MTRGAVAAVFVAAAALGCRSSSTPEAPPVDAGIPPPARPTALSISQRKPPIRAPGQSVVTDGRERSQGRKLRGDVDGLCKDDKQCRFKQCGALCASWMGKAYGPGELQGATHKNQVYINCIGACLGPEPGEKK